jgi:transposase
MSPRQPNDRKTKALRQRGCLNPQPAAVTDKVFAEHEFFDARDVVQVKYEMLRKARVDGAPVSHVAQAFGLSRVSFYNAKEAFETGGLAALVPQKPGPRSAHKLTADVMRVVREKRVENPTLTSLELAELLKAKFRISVHPRSIERALARQKKNGCRSRARPRARRQRRRDRAV